jgi:hypothetical protein
VYLYLYPHPPIPATHEVGSGVILTKLHLFKYILNNNYQTTLQAGGHRCGPGETKEKRNKRNGPGDACPLDQTKERKYP